MYGHSHHHSYRSSQTTRQCLFGTQGRVYRQGLCTWRHTQPKKGDLPERASQEEKLFEVHGSSASTELKNEAENSISNDLPKSKEEGTELKTDVTAHDTLIADKPGLEDRESIVKTSSGEEQFHATDAKEPDKGITIGGEDKEEPDDITKHLKIQK